MSAEQLITEHIDLWTATIKAKNTQGRGSSKKRELYGIKKLRELILELAVRGKLVPQDSNEEPANVLLEHIKREKAELIEHGKIKKQKTMPEIQEEEKRFKLPDGWEWVRVGYIGNIFNGNSVNAKLKEEKYTNIEGLPFIATKDVGYGFEPFDYSNGICIPEGEPKFRVARAGSVLVCAEGGSAGKKCGIANRDICFGNKLFANELYGGISPAYILSNYLTPTFYGQFNDAMTGIIGGISTSKFFKLVVPMPPINEQYRIVDKVGELMALCDQLEQQTESSLDAHNLLIDTLLTTLTGAHDALELCDNWVRLADHFNTLITTDYAVEQLKQTILQLAIQGKLVTQDPNDEPASELLKRIAAEKEFLIKNKKIRNQKSLPPISDEEKIFELPEKWEWERYGQLGYDLGGGTPSKSNSEYWNGEIPWVSPKDMKVDYIFSAQDSITDVALENSTVKIIPVGSLLMVVRGMILAHSFPVAITKVPVVINQDMKALVLSGLDENYILLMMKGFKGDMVNLVDRSSHGTCKLVSEKLWGKAVGIPPLKEQHRIVIKVNELLALCDQLKARLDDVQAIQLHFTDAMIDNVQAQ